MEHKADWPPGLEAFCAIPRSASMTKADLINVIAEKAHLQHKQAEIVVNMVFDMMADALKKDDRIEIRGFGSFVNRSYGSYQGRNPKTGQVVQVPPKRVPFFKVGKELKEMVDYEDNRRAGGKDGKA
jgi:integration host factor subunit beta